MEHFTTYFIFDYGRHKAGSSDIPIDHNFFHFTGSHYGAGTFTSPYRCVGYSGLNGFLLWPYGYISGGPWDFVAYFQAGSWEITILSDGPITVTQAVSIVAAPAVSEEVEAAQRGHTEG